MPSVRIPNASPTAGPREMSCDGACIDTSFDQFNCGGCGITCGPDAICEESECVSQCMYPQLTCGAACVDIEFDAQNCGDCGVVCESGICEGFSCTKPQTCGNDICEGDEDVTCPQDCNWWWSMCMPGMPGWPLCNG